MSEIAATVGFAAISFMFGYYAFNLKDSPNALNQKIAVFLSILSLIFLNILLYMLYIIISETMPYVSDRLLVAAILIMIWATNFILLYVLIAAIAAVGVKMYELATGKTSRKDEGDDA